MGWHFSHCLATAIGRGRGQVQANIRHRSYIKIHPVQGWTLFYENLIELKYGKSLTNLEPSGGNWPMGDG